MSIRARNEVREAYILANFPEALAEQQQQQHQPQQPDEPQQPAQQPPLPQDEEEEPR